DQTGPHGGPAAVGRQQGERRLVLGADDDGGGEDAEQALAHDQAGRQQHAHAAGHVGVAGRLDRPVVQPAADGADDQHGGDGGGQVDADAGGQRRQLDLVVGGAAQDDVEDDDQNADHGADADQVPAQIARDDAFGQGRDQGRLRRRQGLRALHDGGRAALEAEGLVHHVQHEGDDQGAGDDADQQGRLLTPGGGLDQLAGLQVLQVVVGDDGHGEDDGGDDQGEGDHGRISGHPRHGQHAQHQQRRDDD